MYGVADMIIYYNTDFPIILLFVFGVFADEEIFVFDIFTDEKMLLFDAFSV